MDAALPERPPPKWSPAKNRWWRGREGNQKQHFRTTRGKGTGKICTRTPCAHTLCLCNWVSIKITNSQTFLSSAHVWRVIIKIRKLNFISLGSSRWSWWWWSAACPTSKCCSQICNITKTEGRGRWKTRFEEIDWSKMGCRLSPGISLHLGRAGERREREGQGEERPDRKSGSRRLDGVSAPVMSWRTLNQQ